MTGPADPIAARFANIQANREAATSATRSSADESTRKTGAAGAAVHAKVRSRLSALRRRSSDRRERWAPADELAIGVVEDDEDQPSTQESVLPRPVTPVDDELEGRDWLR